MTELVLKNVVLYAKKRICRKDVTEKIYRRRFKPIQVYFWEQKSAWNAGVEILYRYSKQTAKKYASVYAWYFDTTV